MWHSTVVRLCWATAFSVALIWPNISFAYPGSMTTMLQNDQLKVTITSNVDQPIRCQLVAGRDTVWMELEAKQEHFKLAKGYRTIDLSLYCKIIKQKTRALPWRLNPNNIPFPAWNKVIFPD
ncbi:MULTISPECIES: hypothetical protein [unclassified Agarivorans]|uniref:hypothetical protein n=1 Tax=unclassified Agarivorans TaxID=2636026 RepID=UPI003D7DBCC0